MGSSFRDVLCGVCSTLALGPALASLQIFKSLTFVSGWYKRVHVLLPFSKRLGEKMTQKKVSRKDFKSEEGLQNSILRTKELSCLFLEESRNEYPSLRPLLL